MRRNTLLTTLTTVGALLLLARPAGGMTAEELKLLIDGNAAPKLIDVRTTAQFQRGHLPGAINIPVTVVGATNLPPLGAVVVYGDGYDRRSVDEAIEALSAKAGITCDRLEGGLRRYGALGGLTTAVKGVTRARDPHVGYSAFARIVESNPDVILVDLRGDPSAGPKPAEPPIETPAPRAPAPIVVHRFSVGEGERAQDYCVVDAGAGLAAALRERLGGGEAVTETLETEKQVTALGKTAAGDENLTFLDLRESSAKRAGIVDLGREFPGVPCWTASFVWANPSELREELVRSVVAGMDRNHSKIYAIIDDGNGGARQLTNAMRASGLRSYVVLAGGEEALVRRGEPGTGRTSQ